MVDLKPLDELELWSRPGAGQLPRWVRGVIVFACAITVFVIAASTYVLWRMDREYLQVGKWAFRNGPPLVMLAVLVAVFLPRSSVSRFVRMAVVLPLVHVLALIVAWKLIPMLPMPLVAQRTPMARDLPVLPVTLMIAGATIIAGALIARRKRDRIHAIVMLALANLLLLGLWLPIATRLWAGTDKLESWNAALSALGSPGQLAISMLVPPFVVAMIFTAISVGRPALARQLRTLIVFCVAMLFVMSMALRGASYHGGYLLYDNFVHLLLGTAMVAVLATCTLSLATWLECRRSSRRLAGKATRRGVISDDDGHIIACLQITSWLRGPRLVTRGFNAMVAGHELPVPAGVEVATSIPMVSSALHTGEAVVILRQGDHVALAGFVERESGESPFRSAQTTVPGPRGVIVGCVGEATTATQSMGLAAWRPSVAYMIIVIVAALPGLLGLFAPTWK